MTAKPYVMKDLGYQRTPTSAMFRVTMPDGTRWDVPAQAIADSRDEHYSADGQDTIGFIRAKKLDAFILSDWAENDMNWADVAEYATEILSQRSPTDYQEGWLYGGKKIVGNL